VANDLGIVARWTASTTGVSNVKVVDKTPTLRNDANIAVSALSENANAAEITMEIESGRGNTASASLNGRGRDATVSGTATGNEIVTVTANAVTGTDETKRTATARAERTAMSVVEPCSLLRTVVNRLEWAIVLLSLSRTHSGSEEGLPMMTYVSPFQRAPPLPYS
jgi:hypothetical protein